MNAELLERVQESRQALAEVFRNRALRRINLAFAGSVIGDWAYAVGVSVFAYRAGGATAVGLYGVARFVSMAIASPFMSTLADRIDRKRVMIVSDVVRFVLVGIAALVIAADGPAGVVYALGILTSLVGTAFRPAQMALLPRLARHPGELTAANVAASTIESIGFFAGPALAGLLLALADVPVVFAFNAVTFLWSAALVALVVVPPATANEVVEETDDGEEVAPARFLAEAGAGFKEILGRRDLRILTGLYCAQTVVAGASLVFGVAIAFDLLGMEESTVGLLDAMVGVGGLVGGFLALVLATRGRLAGDFGIGVLLWSLPLLLVVVSPTLPSALVAMVLLGVGNSLVDINAFTIMQRLVPDEVMGRVFGALDSALIAGMAIGSLVMPLLISSVGLRAGLLVLGSAVGVVALLCLRSLRRIDQVALAPEGLDLFRGVSLFAPLPERSIERLARSSVVVEVTAGEEVFHLGDRGDRFYVIEDGEAVAQVTDERSVTLGVGGSFGEIALLRDVPRTATVRAVTDLRLRAVERRVFLSVVTGHEEAATNADRLVTRTLVADRRPR